MLAMGVPACHAPRSTRPDWMDGWMDWLIHGVCSGFAASSVSLLRVAGIQTSSGCREPWRGGGRSREPDASPNLCVWRRDGPSEGFESFLFGVMTQVCLAQLLHTIPVSLLPTTDLTSSRVCCLRCWLGFFPLSLSLHCLPACLPAYLMRRMRWLGVTGWADHGWPCRSINGIQVVIHVQAHTQ